MIKQFVARVLTAADTLIEKIPTPLRRVGSPILAPFGAAARTLLVTVSGNLDALADEPLLVVQGAVQAGLELAGASLRDRLIAAATVFARAVLHTGVGPNAALPSADRVGDPA